MVFINRQFYCELSAMVSHPPDEVKLGIVTKSSALIVAIRYGVRAIPNLLFFKNGEVKD
jgi:thioredoxin-like negative regulator of GroEL